MRADLLNASDALVGELVAMPDDAPDVCPLCRSGRTRPTTLCSSCERTSHQVDYPCDLVIPISYYTTPSRLRDRMHDFKESEDASVRRTESRNVASIAARYLAEHHDDLMATFGPWDATVAVPSTHHDSTPALQLAIEANFPEPFEPFERPLLRGSGDMGFNRADNEGFALSGDYEVAGRTFLLIDDTFTTGARVQSAHHALCAGGAKVAVVIIVTRKINPDHKYGSDRLWERQCAMGFDFTAKPWWAK